MTELRLIQESPSPGLFPPERLTIPYSNVPRQVSFDALPDGYGYAFNFDNPSGVKLIPPSLFLQLRGETCLSKAATISEEIRSAIMVLHRNPYGPSVTASCRQSKNMMVPRIILTHVPRTGGTSLFAALKAQLPEAKAGEFESFAELAMMTDGELNMPRRF